MRIVELLVIGTRYTYIVYDGCYHEHLQEKDNTMDILKYIIMQNVFWNNKRNNKIVL